MYVPMGKEDEGIEAAAKVCNGCVIGNLRVVRDDRHNHFAFIDGQPRVPIKMHRASWLEGYAGHKIEECPIKMVLKEMEERGKYNRITAVCPKDNMVTAG